MFVVYIIPKSSPKSSCSVFLFLNVFYAAKIILSWYKDKFTDNNKKGSVGAARKVSPGHRKQLHFILSIVFVLGQG